MLVRVSAIDPNERRYADMNGVLAAPQLCFLHCEWAGSERAVMMRPPAAREWPGAEVSVSEVGSRLNADSQHRESGI